MPCQRLCPPYNLAAQGFWQNELSKAKAHAKTKPCARFGATFPALRLILRRQPPLYPPALEHRFDLLGDEEACAVLVIVLIAQGVVVRKHVPHIGDEREPRRLLGCGIA